MCLWVFGDYASDVTIEIDSEYINRRFPTGKITIDNNSALSIERGTILCLRQGTKKFYVEINIDTADTNIGPLKFKGGQKFSLVNSPTTTPSDNRHDIEIPIKKINWGGGGVNLVNAIREISSSEKTRDVKLTVITNDFDNKKNIVNILKAVREKGGFKSDDEAKLSQIVESLQGDWDEELVKRIAVYLSSFTAEDSLEVFLKKEGVNFHFVRVNGASDKINIVISQVVGDKVTIKDKIILRGKDISLPEDFRIDNLGVENNDTFIMLNSIKDKTLFKKGMEIGVAAAAANETVRGIIAMTDANQEYLDMLMTKDSKDAKKITSFHLICNETEVVKFITKHIAKYLTKPKGRKLQKVITHEIHRRFFEHLDVNTFELEKEFVLLENGKINFVLVKKLFNFIRNQVYAQVPNNIYITFGKYGSIGIDRNNDVYYVGTYPTRGLTIYDSTGCGDYWAAGITLLEYHRAKASNWRKAIANKKSILQEVDKQFREEMNIGDFMKIASAIAFCKLTNPIGRISLDDVLFNLKNNYIPSFSQAFDSWMPEASNAVDEIPPKTAEIAYKGVLDHILG